jgi:hypothetical protein
MKIMCTELSQIDKRCSYAQNRKIGKPNNLKMFGSNKTKKLKLASQNRSHIGWFLLKEKM